LIQEVDECDNLKMGKCENGKMVGKPGRFKRFLITRYLKIDVDF
jgi:hypothetical protein